MNQSGYTNNGGGGATGAFQYPQTVHLPPPFTRPSSCYTGPSSPIYRHQQATNGSVKDGAGRNNGFSSSGYFNSGCVFKRNNLFENPVNTTVGDKLQQQSCFYGNPYQTSAGRQLQRGRRCCLDPDCGGLLYANSDMCYSYSGTAYGPHNHHHHYTPYIHHPHFYHHANGALIHTGFTIGGMTSSRYPQYRSSQRTFIAMQHPGVHKVNNDGAQLNSSKDRRKVLRRNTSRMYKEVPLFLSSESESEVGKCSRSSHAHSRSGVSSRLKMVIDSQPCDADVSETSGGDLELCDSDSIRSNLSTYGSSKVPTDVSSYESNVYSGVNKHPNKGINFTDDNRSCCQNERSDDGNSQCPACSNKINEELEAEQSTAMCGNLDEVLTKLTKTSVLGLNKCSFSECSNGDDSLCSKLPTTAPVSILNNQSEESRNRDVECPSDISLLSLDTISPVVSDFVASAGSDDNNTALRPANGSVSSHIKGKYCPETACPSDHVVNDLRPIFCDKCDTLMYCNLCDGKSRSSASENELLFASDCLHCCSANEQHMCRLNYVNDCRKVRKNSVDNSADDVVCDIFEPASKIQPPTDVEAERTANQLPPVSFLPNSGVEAETSRNQLPPVSFLPNKGDEAETSENQSKPVLSSVAEQHKISHSIDSYSIPLYYPCYCNECQGKSTQDSFLAYQQSPTTELHLLPSISANSGCRPHYANKSTHVKNKTVDSTPANFGNHGESDTFLRTDYKTAVPVMAATRPDVDCIEIAPVPPKRTSASLGLFEPPRNQKHTVPPKEHNANECKSPSTIEKPPFSKKSESNAVCSPTGVILRESIGHSQVGKAHNSPVMPKSSMVIFSDG